MVIRCEWGTTNEKLIQYHDDEWGVPVHDDQKLFESLILDGFQAGLSWTIILNKRDSFRQAFFDFDPQKVAMIDSAYIEELLNDTKIIRNRAKILATLNNASKFLNLQQEFGSFDRYIWGFVDGKPVQNAWASIDQIPASSALAETISADLKKRGFKFVGPTICYAFLQSIGVVNDHVTHCFRYEQLKLSETK